MDAARYGPLGVSLFAGARAYRILGDRTLSIRTEKRFEDNTAVFTPETDVAQFEVKVDPWMFRAHVGIRFYWLGNRK
jgi:hypothetical protein